MKKLFAASCLAGCLAMAVPAMAAVQTFGPESARFTIDIPEGWTATPRDDGCQVTSSDGNSSMVVQIKNSDGRTSAELAKALGGKCSRNPRAIRFWARRPSIPTRPAWNASLTTSR